MSQNIRLVDNKMDTQASVHSLGSSCILHYNPTYCCGNYNEVTYFEVTFSSNKIKMFSNTCFFLN